MADQLLSEIEVPPIGKDLIAFRASFALLCGSRNISCTLDALDQLIKEDIQNLGLDLVHSLRLKQKHGALRDDLLRLNSILSSDDFGLDRIKPLLKAALDIHSDDALIWDQVRDAITAATPPRSQPVASAAPTTPPPPRSGSTLVDSTPLVRSTSSFQGKDQTKKILDQALLHELRGTIFRGVNGFFEKYFESQSWTKQCKAIYQSIKPRYIDGRWADFPDPAIQEDILAWLLQFQKDFLLGASSTYYYAPSTNAITGGEAQRQLDIFLKPKEINTPKHDWKDILVIGEHKQAHPGPKGLLLQLSRYMRDLFTSQPTRRFAHGFFLHGTKMELWVFDRSGPYSSGEFDIHEEPEKFILSLAGYAFMSNEELGLDTFTDCRSGKRTITFASDMRGKKRKLQLDQEPFVKQRAIVCRGTTCFRTTDHNNVVKFSWTSDKRPPEADYLRLAHEKGIKGIAQFVGYQSITSIADLRKGLTFHRPWTIHNASEFDFSSRSLTSRSSLLLQQVTTAELKGQSISLSGSMAQVAFQKSHELRKRNSTDRQDITVPAKKQRVSQHSSGLRHELKPNAQGSLHAPGSLYEPSPDPYDNRQFGCLAISPAGRALNSFTSILELLTALRDAIRAHQSLYLTGKILHRDISENNIIITDSHYGFTGMLIDLDLAKQVGTSRTGARYLTGTMEFMAIEVLRKAAHTFRHDLESFLYVLLWICGVRTWERGFHCDPKARPSTHIWTTWYMGSFEAIALSKQGHMHADGFEVLLAQFPPSFTCVKPLCSRLRRILFPISTEGKLFISTPLEPEPLYDAIIKAFDNAISSIADSVS